MAHFRVAFSLSLPFCKRLQKLGSVFFSRKKKKEKEKRTQFPVIMMHFSFFSPREMGHRVSRHHFRSKGERKQEKLALFLFSPFFFWEWTTFFVSSLSSLLFPFISPFPFISGRRKGFAEIETFFAPSFGTRRGMPEMALEIGKMWQILCRLVPYKKKLSLPPSGQEKEKQSNPFSLFLPLFRTCNGRKINAKKKGRGNTQELAKKN